MQKQKGMNKHQKAVYKVGERRTGREEIEEMLALSQSVDVEDRLCAAEHLCPCHVRTRIPAVWDALFQMMEDADKRVRQQAWHTIEDGGKPSTAEDAARLEQICARESDPKVKRFAESTLDKVLGSRKQQELASLKTAHLWEIKLRGKCDFCGQTNLPVSNNYDVMIPNGEFPRPALTCDACALP